MFGAGLGLILVVVGVLLVGYALYAIIRAAVRDGILQARQRSEAGRPRNSDLLR